MKTWITNGYVYHYDKRRMERKDLCIEDGKICEICSPDREKDKEIFTMLPENP